jgi:hypothetical protein
MEWVSGMDWNTHAATANSKADGNNSRIQALEAEDVVIKEKINKNELLKADKAEVVKVEEKVLLNEAELLERAKIVELEAVDAKTAENKTKVDNVIIKADANKSEIDVNKAEILKRAKIIELEAVKLKALANEDELSYKAATAELELVAEKVDKKVDKIHLDKKLAELKKIKEDLCSLYELTGQPLPLSCLIQSVTLAYENAEVDLESGQIRDCFIDPLSCDHQPPFDLRFAFNAGRSNPTVLFQTRWCGSFSPEIAFLDGTIFSSVTVADIPNLTFTTSLIDVPFDPDDTIVLHTCDGNYFKIGNAICNAYDPTSYPDCSDPNTPIGTVTADYQLLE